MYHSDPILFRIWYISIDRGVIKSTENAKSNKKSANMIIIPIKIVVHFSILGIFSILKENKKPLVQGSKTMVFISKFMMILQGAQLLNNWDTNGFHWV